jgi:2-polyprenyl-3-methyl-5-hydroxy-6-metoxy-1,4-benzoquinol methylase
LRSSLDASVFERRPEKDHVMQLTSKQHWDHVWEEASGEWAGTSPGRRKSTARRLLGDRIVSFKNAYNDYLLWNVHLPRYLVRQPGLKVIEVGSAPGLRLVRFRDRFGYTPYGVEYSNSGVELNRRLFTANGIPPENVFHADFMSAEFLQEHAARYDVVFSWSFMEHFADARLIAHNHVHLLKPGGTLLVMIPNLRGLYGPLVRFLRPDWLNMHNYALMDPRALEAAFADLGLTPLFCGYSGLFSFSYLQCRPGSPERHLLAVAKRLQLPLNALHRLVFPRGGPESRLYSQDLLFIGRLALHDGEHRKKPLAESSP